MAKALTAAQITQALSRRLLGSAHTRTMMAYYRERLPRLRQPARARSNSRTSRYAAQSARKG